MQSTHNSPALPSPKSRAPRLLALALGWIGLACAPEGVLAQVALELDSGSARIWTSSATVEHIQLAPSRVAHDIESAEGGHVIAGDDLGSDDLFFLLQAGGRVTELPTPPTKTGDLRSSPVLLTADGRLAGSAWLEGSGPQSFTVLAAQWNGTSWESVETVSIQKTGPQLALSAAVLDDGSWLILWAGYDGTDDDIFWSRRLDGIWSKPRRLHADNSVPDLLPAISASGAVRHVAWSQFDGSDYRIRSASWTGSGWSPEQTLDGRGPGRPTFDDVDGRSFLSFRTVVPDLWNLVEFEASGSARQTRVSSPYREPPLVVLDPAGTASLAWPWRLGADRR